MPQLANISALVMAGLAIPIVIFYILKIRLRRVPVATIMFWRQIFDEKKPRSLWQRLRHLLSLLLQLAFLALLVFALAEPYFPWESRSARRIVLIVDNSASMNANDVKPTRLAKAKDEGLRLIDGLRFRDEMAILSASSEPRVFSGLTDHQRTLRSALDSIPSSDGPTSVPQAVELAKRLLADHANRRIVVLTDGGFTNVDQFANDKDVSIVAVGKKTGNVAITRFQVRRSLLDPIGYEILAEAANLSDDPVECRIEINLDDDPIDVVPLKLEAGGKWSQVFEKISAEGGRLKATINHADALAADNNAWAILPRRETQKVTLVTQGNLFLEKVFEAIPLVRLTLAKEPPASTNSQSITVFHRTVPKKIPAGRVLVIDPEHSTDLWTSGETLPNPVVAKQDKDSALMAHVRLDNVLMPEARKLELKGPVQVLAASADGDPLYAQIKRPEGSVLVLTVNLDKSDLPLQTAFPILVTNAMAWFAGEKGELRESLAAGSMTELTIPKPAVRSKNDEMFLRAPDGSLKPLPAVAGEKTTIGPLDACGIWGLVRKRDDKPITPDQAAEIEVACNLANRQESDLRTPSGLKSQDPKLTAGFGGRPIWYYLIALAWFMAAWEWYLYQRRWID